jgi:uncharacterized protein YjbI with pentapeptide repeats
MSESESPAHCSYQGCTRPVHGDTGLCIFHAPADKKDPQEFRNALARQTMEWQDEKAEKWDFSGWVFVEADFYDHLFRRDMDFTAAQFVCKASFGSSHFLKDALFENAQFTDTADFMSAQFTGKAGFRSVRFMGEAGFRSVRFRREADFESAQFTGGASFGSAQFTGDADFYSAQFIGRVEFLSAQFVGNASFESAQFTGSAVFYSVQFAGGANFGSVQFAGGASFYSVQFTGNADFESAQFAEDAYFVDAQFAGIASFYSVQFTGNADFESAHFYKEADFMGASFQRELNLTYVSFAVLGDFSECKMLGHVHLLWPGEGKTRIQSTKGEEEKALTASAEIQRGKLLLKNLHIEPPGVLDLRRNSLAPDCELVIEDCRMERILLEGTDCTRIRFYNCQWSGPPGRRMVADEWLARPYLKRRFRERLKRGWRSLFHKRRSLLAIFRGGLPDWRLIELTYQQLAKRFREDFNHSTANDFDCGVFEMRRAGGYQRNLKEGKPRAALQKKWLSLVALYRYLSNYSANFWLPLIWLVVVIQSWAVGYCLTTRPNIHDCCSWNFGDFLGLSLQVSYLNRAGLEFARGNSIGVNVLMALQVVFTATLVALFVFAIRRRFRHG